jgi:hypothetical protein
MTASYQRHELMTVVLRTCEEIEPVIPGRAEGASPESIITGCGYGFRAPSLRSGPGMTRWDFFTSSEAQAQRASKSGGEMGCR